METDKKLKNRWSPSKKGERINRRSDLNVAGSVDARKGGFDFLQNDLTINLMIETPDSSLNGLFP